MRAQKRAEAACRFEAEIYRVVRDVAADAVRSGLATLEEDREQGCLRLIPNNPAACSLEVHADYPTLCMGSEGHCAEMFGSQESRLRELPRLVEAVIHGRYEWEYRQRRRLFVTFTQLVGTFHTPQGPWVFTVQGSEPSGAVARRTYDPY